MFGNLDSSQRKLVLFVSIASVAVLLFVILAKSGKLGPAMAGKADSKPAAQQREQLFVAPAPWVIPPSAITPNGPSPSDILHQGDVVVPPPAKASV